MSAAGTLTAAAVGTQYARVLEALRPAVMAPRVAAALGAPAARPLHVLDAKYEPGVRATVLYRLGDRLVRGEVLPDGTAPDDSAPGAERRPVVAPGVLLAEYPDDPDLPGLPAAADPRTWSGPTAARVDLLRYRPGKRATLAVRRRGGDGPAPTVVAKVYAAPAKAAAVAAEGVALAAAHAGGPLRLARVVAHDPGLSVVVQEHVGGRPLDALLVAGLRERATPGGRLAPGLDVPQAALRRAGAAVAALHAGPVLSERRRDVGVELARLAARADRVAAVAPGAGAALAALAGRLRQVGGRVPPGPTSLVHGDCKPSQVLLDDDATTLLDLDHCGLAEPASDLGTFLASLRQLAVRSGAPGGTFPAAWLDAASAAFLAGYAARVPLDEPDLARVTWYEAVALQRKAFRAFSRAPASPLPALLVAQGHRRLDAIGGPRR